MPSSHDGWKRFKRAPRRYEDYRPTKVFVNGARDKDAYDAIRIQVQINAGAGEEEQAGSFDEDNEQ